MAPTPRNENLVDPLDGFDGVFGRWKLDKNIWFDDVASLDGLVAFSNGKPVLKILYSIVLTHSMNFVLSSL